MREAETQDGMSVVCIRTGGASMKGMHPMWRTFQGAACEWRDVVAFYNAAPL